MARLVHLLAHALLALGTAVVGGIDRATSSAHASAEGAAGWSLGPPTPEEGTVPCTLQRLETLDAETFATKYAGKRPFILSAGGVNGTLSQHAGRWERAKFLAEFGNSKVPVGKPRSREAVRIDHMARLHDYVNNLLAPADSPDVPNDACLEDGEGSLYLFDRGEFFDRNPAVPWGQPSFLTGAARANNQAWRGVFALGAKGTGFPFHLHGDAWLEVLAGTKRWAIYSMAEVGTPPGGYAEARPHSAWQKEVYPDLLTGKQRGPMPLECVQRPGEVVYVRKRVPVLWQPGLLLARCCVFASTSNSNSAFFMFCSSERIEVADLCRYHTAGSTRSAICGVERHWQWELRCLLAVSDQVSVMPHSTTALSCNLCSCRNVCAPLRKLLRVAVL